MTTLYKVLAEVKLFHEYYLTEDTGRTVFEYAAQHERNDFLSRSFEADRPTIANDISFEIFPNTTDLFVSHKLRLMPSYSGFKILVQVTAKKLADNSIVFSPAFPLPTGIIVGLKRKNSAMDAYTNTRINTALPSIFYFSNTGDATTKEFPVLSARVPDYNVMYSYEQGELSLSLSGAVQSYFMNDNGNEEWIPVPGNGFANEQERKLVTPGFKYTFPLQAAVTEASFRLLDGSGQEVRTYTIKDSNGVRTVPLNLNTPALFSGLSNKLSERFILEVTGNNFYEEREVVFIDTDLDLRDYWGVVHLVPRVEDEQFSLIDADGNLRIRKNPDGSTTVPEYFEIRVKSRPTFWRYVNQHGKKIKVNATLDDFLKYDAVRGVMTSVFMRNAASTPTDFRGNGSARFFPHPLSFDPVTIEDGRFITVIRVPRSNLFDV